MIFFVDHSDLTALGHYLFSRPLKVHRRRSQFVMVDLMGVRPFKFSCKLRDLPDQRLILQFVDLGGIIIGWINTDVAAWFIDEVVKHTDGLNQCFAVLLNAADNHFTDLAGELPLPKRFDQERGHFKINTGPLGRSIQREINILLGPGNNIHMRPDVPEGADRCSEFFMRFHSNASPLHL